MYYKCTLLKDLPNFNAGTVFYFTPHKLLGREEYMCQFPGDNSYGYPNYQINKETIDNPDWVKIEVDEDCLTDVKCRCGNTLLYLEPRDEPCEVDDGVRDYVMGIYAICPKCNKERCLQKFVTHSKVLY